MTHGFGLPAVEIHGNAMVVICENTRHEGHLFGNKALNLSVQQNGNLQTRLA